MPRTDLNLSACGGSYTLILMRRAAVLRRRRVGFVSDAEGNFDWFMAYVGCSKVLRKVGQRLELQDDDCHFVYGGDALDHGPGEQRLVGALVELKERYPDRVSLLLGNRDINKMRLTSELAEVGKRPPAEIPGPYWQKKEYRVDLSTFLKNREASQPKYSPLDFVPAKWKGGVDTKAARLQWILRHTMGAPRSYHFRREEMALLQGVAV